MRNEEASDILIMKPSPLNNQEINISSGKLQHFVKKILSFGDEELLAFVDKNVLFCEVVFIN